MKQHEPRRLNTEQRKLSADGVQDAGTQILIIGKGLRTGRLNTDQALSQLHAAFSKAIEAVSHAAG